MHVEHHLDGLPRTLHVVGLKLGQDFGSGQCEGAVEPGAGRLHQVDDDLVGNQMLAAPPGVRRAGDVLRAQPERDVAAGMRLQGGGACSRVALPQQGRLAAAGRTDEDRELPFGDIQVDAAHGLDLAVGLLDPLQAESCRESQPLTAPSEMPRTR